jgi:GT2 family glycosyltransferase
MSIHVSVLIPCCIRNAVDQQLLFQCLTALTRQTYSEFEVIVIDNNSAKGIKPTCDAFGAKYIQEFKPGNNAARNAGIRAANGDAIAITDHDTIPAPDWIASGVEALQKHPRAIVGGHIAFYFKGASPTVIEYADSISYLRQQDYCEQEHYAAGANWWMWRSLVDEIGGFEERLLNVGDLELGQRAYAQGVEIIYSSTAVVSHPARATYRELMSKTRRQAKARNQLAWLRGEKVRRSLTLFLPEPWQFFQLVKADAMLPRWKQKSCFIGIIHAMKWTVAIESLWGFPSRRGDR